MGDRGTKVEITPSLSGTTGPRDGLPLQLEGTRPAVLSGQDALPASSEGTSHGQDAVSSPSEPTETEKEGQPLPPEQGALPSPSGAAEHVAHVLGDSCLDESVPSCSTSATADVLQPLQWQPCLVIAASSKPQPRRMLLDVRTSADLPYWDQHKHYSRLFGVGLVGDMFDVESISIAAVDLATSSCWFQAFLDNRHAMNSKGMRAVLVPCSIASGMLRQLVMGLYEGALLLSADNVEPIYRAADAMQMPALVAACEEYLLTTSCDCNADPLWVLAVYNLACDLSRHGLCSSIAEHYATEAQRDAARHKHVLCHVLQSSLFADRGAKQMALLRDGHVRAWQGYGLELLLVHVILEVQEALSAEQLPDMLEQVNREGLLKDEVMVLVDWAMSLPACAPLAPLLRHRALQCVAAQPGGHGDEQRQVWKVDVAEPFTSRTRAPYHFKVQGAYLYLSLELIVDGKGPGLYLFVRQGGTVHPPVQNCTFFVLGPHYNRRVMMTHVQLNSCRGCLVTGWLSDGMYKELQHGAKSMTVGVIATHIT